MRLGDRRDDREPESRARHGAVGALEALEDPLEVGRLDPAPLVGDPHLEQPVAHARADLDGAALGGELHGVRSELEPRLREALAVDLALGVGPCDERPRAVAEQSSLVEHVVGQQPEILALRLDEVGPLRAREQREVVDEPSPAVDLVERERARRLDVVDVVRVDELEVAAQHRERGA